MGTYLVTGGAGFIGSHIVEALAGRGDRVRIFDNFATGKKENIVQGPRVELVEGDLRDLAAVRHATRGVDAVFHQGALPSVSRSVADPITSHEVNVTGTLHALMAAREAGVKRFVFAGSSSVYGDGPLFPRSEEAAPRPLSPYAASKAAGEAYCSAFAAAYGVPTVVLRYFNVFGPRQDAGSPYSGVIARFAAMLHAGQVPRIEGDGGQSRDFTYVDNVVQANLLALEAEVGSGEAINVAMGEEVTVLELYHAIRERLGVGAEPVHVAPRTGDVRRSIADVSRARKLLGYRPAVDFATGLDRTLGWYRGQATPPAAG